MNQLVSLAYVTPNQQRQLLDGFTLINKSAATEAAATDPVTSSIHAQITTEHSAVLKQ